jgi:hypothetical protein
MLPLIGLESLRSVILAVQRLKLSDVQVEDIFYGFHASVTQFKGMAQRCTQQ